MPANLNDRSTQKRKTTLFLQSLFYLFTGIWPLMHISSFLAGKGEEADNWLLVSAGSLLLCIVCAFFIDLYARRNSASIIFLAIASSVAFLCVDFHYSVFHAMSKLYIVDAAIHLVLMTLWSFWMAAIARES